MGRLFFIAAKAEREGTMDQILREFQDITTPELFRTYHPTGYSHLMERHINKSLKDLKARLRKIPFNPDGDLTIMSRFNEDIDEQKALDMAYQCLLANENEIRKWAKKITPKKDFIFEFPTPIGDGIVKGSDWNKTHKFSAICVVLGPSNRDGRLFEIISIYPTPGFEEIDEVWEAVQWTE